MIFVTDGMLERDTQVVDISTLIEAGADLHPREAVQRLMQAVVEVTGGKLEDDATIPCLDWRGGRPRHRLTNGGADRH